MTPLFPSAASEVPSLARIEDLRAAPGGRQYVAVEGYEWEGSRWVARLRVDGRGSVRAGSAR